MKSKILLITAILTVVSAFGQTKVYNIIKGQPVFGYIDSAHTKEINNTRSSVGSPLLKRDSRLDSLALLRCLRYAKLMISDTRYIEDTTLVKKETHKGFSGLFKSENSTYHLFGAGFAAKQFSELTPALVSGKINATKYDPGKEYNNSHRHYENRVNPVWKKFGSATVVIFIQIKNPDYDPKEISLEYIPKAIFLNYEVFE